MLISNSNSYKFNLLFTFLINLLAISVVYSFSPYFKTSVFAAGGVIGYQWNWNPVTLDIYGGPAYYSVDADDPTFDFGFDGIGARLGVSLGFAF